MSKLSNRVCSTLALLAVVISASPVLVESAYASEADVPAFLSSPAMESDADRRSYFPSPELDEAGFEAIAWHDGKQVYVGFTIPDQLYMYRKHFDLTGDQVGSLRIPQGINHQDEFFGEVAIFRDSVVMAATLGKGANTSDPISLNVAYQGCADYGVCYPPSEVSLTAELKSLPPSDFYLGVSEIPEVAGSQVEDANTAPLSETDSTFEALLSDASVPMVLAVFFLAGLGLTFTPCVLPMIPIMSALIVGQKPSRRRALALSSSYVAGMATTYTAAGVLMGLFGASLNLQARLQSPVVLSIFAGIFFILALAMMGTFDVRLPSRLATRVDGWQSRAQRSGAFGIAVTGALSVLVVSPCVSAPLAGALVFISSTGDAWSGGMALLAMALGMGVPLILVGTFGGSLLPRRGAWMNGVKITFGVMMLAIAAWLLDRILPSTTALLMWAGLAVVIASLMGIFAGPQSTLWGKVRQGLAVFPLVWAIALILSASSGGNNPLRPLEHLRVTEGAIENAGPVATVTSLGELQAILEASQANGVPVVANLTADWCSSCKVMERRYAEPDVAKALSGYTRVAIDITDNSPEAREVLNSSKVFGPPSLLFYRDGEQVDSFTLQGEVNSDALIQHLNRFKGDV